jgi:hypothetical protein
MILSEQLFLENQPLEINIDKIGTSTGVRRTEGDEEFSEVENKRINDSLEQSSYKLKLAFYVYFYGSDNHEYFFIPEVPFINYNCYYITNNINLFEKLKNTRWIGVFDDIITIEDIIESNLAGKKVKSVPESFFELSKYDYLCYLDTKYLNKNSSNDEIRQQNENIIKNYINEFFIKQNYALVLPLHPFIKSKNVWSEFNESMCHYRYRIERNNYINYINQQINSGLKEETEYHYTTCFLLRNMKHNKIHEINNTWYEHIMLCGIQCQIAFFFSKQKYNEYIYHILQYPHI